MDRIHIAAGVQPTGLDFYDYSAMEFAARPPDASTWACLGYDDESVAFDQWHPPSTDFDPDS